jgi:hypothetical protein
MRALLEREGYMGVDKVEAKKKGVRRRWVKKGETEKVRERGKWRRRTRRGGTCNRYPEMFNTSKSVREIRMPLGYRKVYAVNV